MILVEPLLQVASLLMLLALPIYFSQIRNGSSVPNPATWMIMSLLVVLNTATYYYTAEKETWKTVMAVIPMLGVLTICVYTYTYGKFAPLAAREKRTLKLAVGLMVFWPFVGSDIANVLIQLLFLSSAYPTIEALRTGDGKEKALPWGIATSAYIIMTIAVGIDCWYDYSKLWQIAYPLIRIPANGLVYYYARKSTQRNN